LLFARLSKLPQSPSSTSHPTNPTPTQPNPNSTQPHQQLLKRVAEKGELVTVALNTHGTRAVQKLIETLTSREQRAIVIDALGPGVVTLIKDLNGNHVVQRCLQRLGSDDSQFIYDAAKRHCVEIATHRHGCCVLQRCIDFATPTQKTVLVAEVARNALVLSQDAFGNYVVQYILEVGGGPFGCWGFAWVCVGWGLCLCLLCCRFFLSAVLLSLPASSSLISTPRNPPHTPLTPTYNPQPTPQQLGQDEASGGVMTALMGHYGELSMQKFSSNVVEKCLKLGGLEPLRHALIRELMVSPLLPRILQDSYGNYVVQSALAVCGGALHDDLIEALRPHVVTLRGTPHGKRILQKMNGK